jgi:hypothetical protein
MFVFKKYDRQNHVKHKIVLHLSIFYEYQQFFQHRICFSIQPPDYSDPWPRLAGSSSFFIILLFNNNMNVIIRTGDDNMLSHLRFCGVMCRPNVGSVFLCASYSRLILWISLLISNLQINGIKNEANGLIDTFLLENPH